MPTTLCQIFKGAYLRKLGTPDIVFKNCFVPQWPQLMNFFKKNMHSPSNLQWPIRIPAGQSCSRRSSFRICSCIYQAVATHTWLTCFWCNCRATELTSPKYRVVLRKQVFGMLALSTAQWVPVSRKILQWNVFSWWMKEHFPPLPCSAHEFPSLPFKILYPILSYKN